MSPNELAADGWLSEGTAALLGVVIGGLISLAGNWLLWRWQRKDEAARWAREDATRFHAERRSAYARYLALVHDLYLEISGDAPPNERLPERLRELSEIHAEISLMASTSVRETADALRVVLVAAAGNREKFQGRDDVSARFLALEEEFRDSARNELGTPETLNIVTRQ